MLRAHYHETDDALEMRAGFVIRYKRERANSPPLNETEGRELSEEDLAAGIVSDRVGYFTSDKAYRAGISKVLLREIVIPYDDNGTPKILRLITNLLDVSASTIALIYKSRWQVELFFRWLKSIANFGHLISYTSGGVQTHLYVTVIGVMLMYLHTRYLGIITWGYTNLR